MKKLIGRLAILAVLGSAAPAIANDVTGDRYAPSRADAARRAPASAAATTPAERGDEAARPAAPCACCAKGGGHAQAAREMSGR